MKYLSLLLFTWTISFVALASDHHVVNALGMSAKGQYVALEEYGYKKEAHTYYVSIRIMNVWKKEYVGSPVRIELVAHRPADLAKARDRAITLARSDLMKFNISSRF